LLGEVYDKANLGVLRTGK